MSGGNLRLQVVLQALDQATGPFRKVLAGSKGLSAALQQQQATLRRLNAAQRDVSAFRQQQEATRGTALAHRDAQERVRQLAMQLAATAAPTRKLSNEFKQAKAAAGLLKAQHQQQAVELQRLRSGLERAGISTRQLGTHERKLRGDIAAATTQMEQQRARLASLDAAMARSRKVHSAGMNAAAHGAGIAFASMAALRVQGFPIAQAMTFESAMADVKKVVNFDTPEQFQQMSQDVEDLSRRLPMVPADIAKIVAAAGQASIPREELVRFAEDAAKMGVAFDTSAEEAGQTMATWRTAFKMGQDDVVVLADKINYLGNTGPASVQKISEVVNRIGALGEVAGLGSGPLAALGATVAGMGIESEVSATGIKNMLLTLSSGDAATKSQITAFKKLGLNAKDMANAMQKDAGGAIVGVLEKLKTLPKAEQAATMTQLFGRESIGAIAPLLTNLELLKGNFDKVTDAQKYGGSMGAEYAARVATSENALQLLKNSALVVAQSIGKTLLPDFKALVDRTAQVIGKVTEWVRANPQLVATIAKVVVVGTALATVLGGLLVAGGVGAMALTQIHKAVALLSGGGGIGRLVGQVVSLGGRAFPMLLNVGRMLLPLLGGVSAPVLAIGLAIGVVAALVWKYWGPIKAFMVGVWQGVMDVVGPIMTELMAALEPLAPVWDMVSSAMGQAWGWVQKLFAPFAATSEQLHGATDAGRGFGQILGTVLTVNLRMGTAWPAPAGRSSLTTRLPTVRALGRPKNPCTVTAFHFCCGGQQRGAGASSGDAPRYCPPAPPPGALPVAADVGHHRTGPAALGHRAHRTGLPGRARPLVVGGRPVPYASVPAAGRLRAARRAHRRLREGEARRQPRARVFPPGQSAARCRQRSAVARQQGRHRHDPRALRGRPPGQPGVPGHAVGRARFHCSGLMPVSMRNM